MKTIRIDDDVYKFLQGRAIPYEESSPNETLRRIFGLESRQIDLFSAKMDEGDQGNLNLLREQARQENALNRPLERRLPQPAEGVPEAPHPGRKSKTNLRILIQAGILEQGQTLYLHDYSGDRIPGQDFEAILSGDRLIWKVDQKSYSLSALAIELLRKRGHRGESVRGPARWYTQAEVSVQDLWDRYLKDQ